MAAVDEVPLSRPEAIRRLLKIALKKSRKS